VRRLEYARKLLHDADFAYVRNTVAGDVLIRVGMALHLVIEELENGGKPGTADEAPTGEGAHSTTV
jgi:hypothetical protein